ncbi:hypothetical protein [Natronomonas sp. EA1]|uniref:hypothetical protein n=1 Tax=Natronomonas sp. EA1 TaxID=3421655 RepID=UPI003EBE0951
MDRTALAGLLITPLALAGYVIGATYAYPGRALTLPGLMVGATLLALGRWSR